MCYFDCKQQGHTWKLTTPQDSAIHATDGHQMTHGENQPCNKFYSTSGVGVGRQKCLLENRNAYSHYHRWHWQTST